MLKNVSLDAFSQAIEASYITIDKKSADNFARRLMESIDSEIEPAVLAWIEGSEIPDIGISKYSIKKILTIRNDMDYLEAFQLLTEYKHNPDLGEKKIWTPKRLKKQRRE